MLGEKSIRLLADARFRVGDKGASGPAMRIQLLRVCRKIRPSVLGGLKIETRARRKKAKGDRIDKKKHLGGRRTRSGIFTSLRRRDN